MCNIVPYRQVLSSTSSTENCGDDKATSFTRLREVQGTRLDQRDYDYAGSDEGNAVRSAWSSTRCNPVKLNLSFIKIEG